MKRQRPPQTALQVSRERVRSESLARHQRLVDHRETKIELARSRQELDKAYRALERMSARQEGLERAPEPDRSALWTGLAVGLGVAAVVGVAGVLVYLLVRKNGQVDGARVVPQGALGAADVEGMMHRLLPAAGGIPEEVGGALKTIADSLNRPQGRWTSPVMKTYRLNSLNDKTRPAIRIAQATDVPYEVVLRTVGPAGGFAAFSFNANELNLATPGALPTGDTIILPTFQWQIMRLRPGDALFAKGGAANTIVSVTMNEALR